MAKDYDFKDLQEALERQRLSQRDKPFLETENQMMVEQIKKMQKELHFFHDKWQSAERRLQEEMRQHNDLYRALEERKKFDDWLKEVYPEVVEQYKAAMRLVEFMEDPPKPTVRNQGSIFSQSVIEKFKQQWVIEAEHDKLIAELKKKGVL